LNSNQASGTACLILDVRMPGMNGLDLQRQMVAANWRIPVVFITSHADDDARARALEAGAVAFLYKPFREEELFNAIDAALKHS
jgi:FixJ family two-component response regulator